MSLKTEFRIGVAARPLAFGQDCKALVAREGIDPLFLAYAIRAQTSTILDMVDEAGHGTGRLNTDQLKALTLDVPSLPEQRAIAEVLGALDDKIESNHRIVGIGAEVTRLELEAAWSQAWTTLPLSQLARFVNGGAYTNGAAGYGRMVIRIAELNRGPGASTVYNNLDVPDDGLARPGDLLMAWSGSLGIHLWSGDEAIINQHIFKVIPADWPAWFVFDRLQGVMPELRQIAADKATTMGHIKRHHLDDTVVQVPPPTQMSELDKLLGQLWRRRVGAELESRTLISLRDALLPELFTGRLRVPMHEEVVLSVTRSV